MTTIETHLVSLSPSGPVKMDDRKRPSSHDHKESGPPLKKQATAVNGGGKAHTDSDVPGQDDLERFQKEAIWRQMQEYKREAKTLESQLSDLTKRSMYHDDHLRTIDAWFSELLDEVRVMVGQRDEQDSFSVFPTGLLSTDNATFEKHLKSRSAEISSAISKLFSQPSTSSIEVSELQARITKLLAAEKGHITALEKSQLEKEQLEERLEAASYRYMLAEKKVDRAKSATVQKLERQAIAGGRSESGSGLGGGIDESKKGLDGVNGKLEDVETLLKAESLRKEAEAASAKQKEHLEALEAENEKLTAQATTLSNRLSHLSEDDYSKTDLYKALRSQHEDVIKRVNDLEAKNIQLRQEAEKLHAERTSYKIQLENESQSVVREKENLIVQYETDLIRIRTLRDEYVAEIQIGKAARMEERASVDETKKLLGLADDRIKALEAEIERLNIQCEKPAEPATPESGAAGLSPDGLQGKFSNLERQYSMLSNELQSMGKAYKKATAQATQKIDSMEIMEEKIMRLGAEKSKADQKYFGAMKAKEARDQEVRSLRAQNNKSSEMITQLKESEASSRHALVNLEKQLAEFKESLMKLDFRHQGTQQQVIEKNIALDGLRAQVEELKKSLVTKDASSNLVSSSFREAETELEVLKVRLEETEKSLESWKKKGLGNQSNEYEMLRALAICTICRVNFKDTAIKGCGHVFCAQCVEDRQSNRFRKCPNCNRAFGLNDTMKVIL